MTTNIREVKESPLRQGVDESISYYFDSTPWGTVPGTLSVAVYDITDNAYTAVTATVMPTGAISAIGDTITLPPLKLLTANHTYRVEVKFTCSGNVFEPFFIVAAEA